MQDKLDYLAKEVGRLHQCNQDLQRLLLEIGHKYNDISIGVCMDTIFEKYKGEKVDT